MKVELALIPGASGAAPLLAGQDLSLTITLMNGDCALELPILLERSDRLRLELMTPDCVTVLAACGADAAKRESGADLASRDLPTDVFAASDTVEFDCRWLDFFDTVPPGRYRLRAVVQPPVPLAAAVSQPLDVEVTPAPLLAFTDAGSLTLQVRERSDATVAMLSVHRAGAPWATSARHLFPVAPGAMPWVVIADPSEVNAAEFDAAHGLIWVGDGQVRLQKIGVGATSLPLDQEVLRCIGPALRRSDGSLVLQVLVQAGPNDCQLLRLRCAADGRLLGSTVLGALPPGAHSAASAALRSGLLLMTLSVDAGLPLQVLRIDPADHMACLTVGDLTRFPRFAWMRLEELGARVLAARIVPVPAVETLGTLLALVATSKPAALLVLHQPIPAGPTVPAVGNCATEVAARLIEIDTSFLADGEDIVAADVLAVPTVFDSDWPAMIAMVTSAGRVLAGHAGGTLDAFSDLDSATPGERRLPLLVAASDGSVHLYLAGPEGSPRARLVRPAPEI